MLGQHDYWRKVVHTAASLSRVRDCGKGLQPNRRADRDKGRPANSETQCLLPKASFVTGFTLSLHRLSACRMSISDAPTKCRINASLRRTDWKAALARSFCTTGRHIATPNKSSKKASTGGLLEKMVRFFETWLRYLVNRGQSRIESFSGNR